MPSGENSFKLAQSRSKLLGVIFSNSQCAKINLQTPVGHDLSSQQWVPIAFENENLLLKIVGLVPHTSIDLSDRPETTVVVAHKLLLDIHIQLHV